MGVVGVSGVWRTAGPSQYLGRLGEWNFVLVTLSAQGALEIYVNGVTQDVSWVGCNAARRRY